MDHPGKGELLESQDVSTPSAEEQVRFLTQIQRLLAEGLFVATYKYALLLALADLAVELGDDTGAALQIPTSRIAEKFIHYYWRQSAPYVTSTHTTATVLLQSTGKQANVLLQLERFRLKTQGNLSDLRANTAMWRVVVNEVRRVVVQMPLWKLQTVGRQPLQFLYDQTKTSRHILLKPTAAFCLRMFHSLVVDLVQAAWTRYVRRLNADILKESIDLEEFLFGSARSSLAAVQPVLVEFQGNRCFYCHRELTPTRAQVDHFIPWSLYPADIGHNFVLAHQSCNGKKADRLASEEHLAAWTSRNRSQGHEIAKELASRHVICDTAATTQIAQWAYSRTEQSGGQVWQRGDDLVPLTSRWRSLLAFAHL